MATKPEIASAESAKAEVADFAESMKHVSFTGPSLRSVQTSILEMQSILEGLARSIDTVRMPGAFFDPTDPRLIGHFVALALLSQPRVPLGEIGKAYGAGVYAVYYTGHYDAYQPISRTETPIYVGKADPPTGAKNLIEQETKLTDRLNEHRRNIEKVPSLDIADFECRALAVQSGYQTAAETHLINLFKPIWNNETRVLFGIGKHGDASSTRANNKSPWDTVHPGRTWAAGNPEAKSISQILDEVAQHLSQTVIFEDTDAVLRTFVTGLSQGVANDG